MSGKASLDGSQSGGLGTIDPERFRDALGLFATGVTIVTASHPTAGLIGITANSFNSVSLDPPLVLFSVANGARSLPAFLEAPGFAVNVLGRDQRALSMRFSVSDDDKWAGVPHELGRFGHPSCPARSPRSTACTTPTMTAATTRSWSGGSSGSSTISRVSLCSTTADATRRSARTSSKANPH